MSPLIGDIYNYLIHTSEETESREDQNYHQMEDLSEEEEDKHTSDTEEDKSEMRRYEVDQTISSPETTVRNRSEVVTK